MLQPTESLLHKNVTLNFKGDTGQKFKKKHFKGKLLFWLTNLYQKEVIKYQQASGPEYNVQKNKTLAGRNLVSIKVNTDGILS